MAGDKLLLSLLFLVFSTKSLADNSKETSDALAVKSHLILASTLPADGKRTLTFKSPMFLYVSVRSENQVYDSNLRLSDESSGARSNAWAAGQGTLPSGAKRPVFPEARTSFTISNFNAHVLDETTTPPAVFYFLAEDVASSTSVYEVGDSVERRRPPPSSGGAVVALLSAAMSISITDLRFAKSASVVLSAGGAHEANDEKFTLMTFNDSSIDFESWANVPLPVVTLSAVNTQSFSFSASSKPAERSHAPVGIRTLVMSPGYPFTSTLPSHSNKHSFQLAANASVHVQFLIHNGIHSFHGTLRMESSRVTVLGSNEAGRTVYNQTYTTATWDKREESATFGASIISVEIQHEIGCQPGVLIRIFTTSGSAAASFNILLLVLLLSFFLY